MRVFVTGASGWIGSAAVEAIGDVLAGTGRPFLLASGIAAAAPGRPTTEDDRYPFHGADAPRGGSENLALERVERGVRSVVLRCAPTVHGDGDHGFVATLVAVARAKGVAGHVGDGANRWTAVHRSDAARLVRLGLEAPAGTVLHAVAEEGVATREIAEAIGRGLGVPVASIAAEDAAEHFGWIAGFFSPDLPATSTRTRQLLGWTPTGPTLVEDLDAGSYFRPWRGQPVLAARGALDVGAREPTTTRRPAVPVPGRGRRSTGRHQAGPTCRDGPAPGRG